MNCPHDGTPLTRRTYEASVEVDTCSTCEGMWLDHGELERIEETLDNDHAQQLNNFPDVVGNAYAMALAASKPSMPCPGCGREMSRREYAYCSQILIDVCPSCAGIWLQAGEISALEVFFERTKAQTSSIRRGFFASLRDLFRT